MRAHIFPHSVAITLSVVLAAGALTASGQTVRLGDTFPNFSETDMRTDKTFELEGLRGKVVLIDFWAMWCMPCLTEISNLRNVYGKYHDDGFEIVSISLDGNVPLCRQFVGNRKMDWLHICDGRGLNAKLAKKHNITSIPRRFLLDHTGTVIGVDQRGNDLRTAINEAVSQIAEVEVDDVQEKEGRKGLVKADSLRDEEKYDEALDMYEELGVKYATRPSGQLANERARSLLDNPQIAEKIRQARGKYRQDRIEQHAQRWLALARQMVQLRRYALARQCYQRIIDRYPDSSVTPTAREELANLPT